MGFAISRAGLVLCIMLACSSAHILANDRDRAVLLFDKAAAVSNIRGSGAFKLTGRLQFFGMKNNSTMEGEFLYLWLDHDHWKFELSIGPYKEIRVGGQDKYYRLRNVDFGPLRVMQWHDGWQSFMALNLHKSDKIKRIYDSELSAGGKATCVQRITEGRASRDDCFDANSGALRRRTVGFQVYE